MAATSLSVSSLRDLVRTAIVGWGSSAPRIAERDDAAWFECVERCRANPLPEDAALVELAEALGLSSVEILAVALAAGADEDPLIASELMRLQAPCGRGRPLLGFFVSRFAGAASPASLAFRISNGAAAASGLLELGQEPAFLERTLSVPGHILHALNGIVRAPAGVTLDTARIEAPRTRERRIIRHAASLRKQQLEALVIRAASMAEARSAAQRIAEALKRAPAFIEAAQPGGLGPWLRLTRRLPVHQFDLAPGESRNIETPKGYSGPQLVAATPEGAITLDGAPIVEWKLDIPLPAERETLWRASLANAALARELGTHRHSVSRIAHLGRLAREIAAVERKPLTLDAFHKAAWSVERHALGQLAIPLEDEVTDDALVLPESLAETLNLLLARCRARDGLDAGLGSSARTRYRPGVRALFSGPPGTGKTLAAGWLAAKLKMPLFRIDLAGVSSKYIGETEKNLAKLLNQAEQSELVLVFDEADSLFGRRTAISDAHDRYANAQTNYLLQRVESFDGIAILTSNHESQLDPAFRRRLDFVIEFANPTPAERRRLWLNHLGEQHDLTPQQINRLASSLEIAGGDIRNAVFHAAVLARERNTPIAWPDIITGVRLEFRKLRLSLPADLQRDEP